MTPLVVLALLIVSGFAVVSTFQGARRQKKLRSRLAESWAMPRAPTRSSDAAASELWRFQNESSAQYVDDRTWLDLNMDDVLATLDRTETTFGRQQLYWRLRTLPQPAQQDRVERLAQLFASNAALTSRVRYELARPGSGLGENFWGFTSPSALLLPRWYSFLPACTALMIAAIVAAPWFSPALVVAVLLVVVNMTIRVATSARLTVLVGPFRQVGPLVTTVKNLLNMHSWSGPAEDADVREAVAALRGLHRRALWVSRDPLDSGDLAASAFEWINNILLLDVNALVVSSREHASNAPALHCIATWLGEVDAAQNVASLRAEPRAWCTPAWVRDSAIRIDGVWSPLVESPVPNDFRVGGIRGLIVTGSNMSGKSTYLRSVGAAVILARALNLCPALSCSMPALVVRSFIGRSDDIISGKSYYMAEVERVVELLQQSDCGPATLFLFDELFRGTNTVERLAAGEAVLRALLRDGDSAPSHACVVATHDGELVSLLADVYEPHHFREQLGDGSVEFDYAIREGAASTRTALALLDQAGASPEVVFAARQRAAMLDGLQKARIAQTGVAE